MDQTLIGLLSSAATAILAVVAWIIKKQLGSSSREPTEDTRPARPVRLSEVDRGLVEQQNALIDRLYAQHEGLAQDWQRQTDTIVGAINGLAQEMGAERRDAAARAARTEEQLRHQERGRDRGDRGN